MTRLNELADLIAKGKGKPVEAPGMLGGTLPPAEALEPAVAPSDAAAVPVLPRALQAHAERLAEQEDPA